MRRLFTSESVTEGHPDKICDQISDAVLDSILEKDPTARVACETAVTTGMVLVMGEISTSCYVDIPKVVRKTIREIGYDRAKYGFDCDTCSASKITTSANKDCLLTSNLLVPSCFKKSKSLNSLNLFKNSSLLNSQVSPRATVFSLFSRDIIFSFASSKLSTL